MTLRFVEKTHRYYLDGRIVTGVTTLLNKGLPKPALTYWSAKAVATWVINNPDGVQQLRAMGDGPAIAALKQVPWQARDEAAIRGTDIHALAEQIIHGQPTDVPEHLAGPVDGYVRWLEAYDVQPLLTEQPVASRQWNYAGKFDAIVEFGRGPWKGQRALVDWKSSKGIYGSVSLQTAAYARAEFFAPSIDDERPLPEVTGTGVVHIEDGQSTFYPLATDPDGIDAAFRVFTHIAYVANKIDWIDGLVGQPWELEEINV